MDYLDINSRQTNDTKKDIDYLRQTLRGNENMFENEQMLDFAEKADNLIEEQEEVVTSHLLCIKEQSKLLQLEGGMLVKVQNSNNEDEDMEDYVKQLELILKRRRELGKISIKLKLCIIHVYFDLDHLLIINVKYCINSF